MKTVLLLIGFILASTQIAEAQQTGKVPRIGFLGATNPSLETARIEAFGQGLRELGYVEGKNIVIEGGQRENSIDCRSLRPNWCVSMWT